MTDYDGGSMGVFFFLGFWIFFIVVTALVAGSKNRSAGGWAFAAALFGVFALIAVACCSKLPTASEIAATREAANTATKVCPRCAETVKAVKAAAQVCRFCGHEFDPSTIPVEPEVAARPWTLVHDHGNGFGIFEYKGEKLVYSAKGVKWKDSTLGNPETAMASIDAYHR